MKQGVNDRITELICYQSEIIFNFHRLCLANMNP